MGTDCESPSLGPGQRATSQPSTRIGLLTLVDHLPNPDAKAAQSGAQRLAEVLEQGVLAEAGA